MRDKPAKAGLVTKLASRVIGQRQTVRFTPTENGFYENGIYHGVTPPEDVRCYQIKEAVREGRLDPRRGHEMLCTGEWLK